MLTADEKVNELTQLLEQQQQDNDNLRQEMDIKANNGEYYNKGKVSLPLPIMLGWCRGS